MFLGTGKALASGGPGNMVIAYAIVCTCVWAVLQTLGEMTIAFPTPGNYIDYAERWVDPALAFGAGFAEWLGMFNFATCRPVDLTQWQHGSPSLPSRQSSSIYSCSFGLKALYRSQHRVSDD